MLLLDLEPAVHRMGASTGWLRSYLDLWPKILRGSCLILRAVSLRASLWAVYLPVRPPNFLCGISQVSRFPRRAREHSVAGSGTRLHPERSKSLESVPHHSQKSYKVYSCCSSKMPRWGDNYCSQCLAVISTSKYYNYTGFITLQIRPGRRPVFISGTNS